MIIVLCGCSSSDKGYVLPSSVDVDTMSFIVPEGNITYTFTEDEFDAVENMLRSEPKLNKVNVRIPIGKESESNKALYTLTINTKAKLLKKADTYSIYVGNTCVSTDMWGKESTSVNTDELRINNYEGTSSSGIYDYLDKLAKRESTAFSKAAYDKIASALVAEGYSLEAIEFNSVLASRDSALHTSLDISGFYARKEGAGMIKVILCHSVESAETRKYNYSTGQSQGANYYRVYYGAYSSEDYQKVRGILATE